MKLKAYIANLQQRLQLAMDLETSPEYLRLIANGHRQAGPRMAKDIEKHTGGQVQKSELRPDLWSKRA